MSNKKLYLIFWLVSAMLFGVVWNFTSAISFKITFGGSAIPARAGYMRRNMTPIHFKDNWNNFGWFIYFSNGIGTGGSEEDGDYIVELGDHQKYECQQRAKWFYYNAERGERLWVLDDSYTMGVAVLSGGLYTRCRQQWFKEALETRCASKKNESEREQCEEQVREEYVDSHGYYWMIRHTYGWNEFVLAAWTNYEPYNGNLNQRVMWNELSGTLIRFDNKYPVWFIYDGNGGLWFLWWEIKGNFDINDVFDAITAKGSLEELFELWQDGIVPSEWMDWMINTDFWWSAKNSLLSVIVDWLVWMNRDTKNTGIQWNQSNEKMQYFSSVNINNMQLINYARQKSETLCRWKWENSVKYDWRVIQCLSGITNSAPVEAKTWWTYIVKNHDVQVMDMDNFDEAWNYDVFIDSWNLIINEVTDELKVFKKNWFISNMNVENFSGYAFSILRSVTGSYTWDEVVAWKFIKWNFIVNGGVKSKNWSWLEHVYFVYWKMTTKDTVDELSKVFKRRCQRWIQGTDGTPCPGEEKWLNHVTTWTNPYENASLVIIDQNYPSPLYQ